MGVLISIVQFFISVMLLRMFFWDLSNFLYDDNFILGASTSASKCEWAWLIIKANIPSLKWQVKTHSSTLLLSSCTAVFAQKYQLFHLRRENFVLDKLLIAKKSY